MYLKNLMIAGFKNFGERFNIEFNKGLSVLIGENGVGKSAAIDAIRILLLEDEFGRSGISEADFNHPFGTNTKVSDCIQLSATFAELTKEEQVAFSPWTVLKDDATLNLQIENKLTNQGRFRRLLWGGASKNSIFEWELMDYIHCIYLPPLRDAEAKLHEGRGSRLARLLKNLNKKELAQALESGELLPIEKEVSTFNKSLSEPGTVIANANELIRSSLAKALGEVFGQDTVIQFSEMRFSNIVENLHLLFFPNGYQGDDIVDDKESLFRSLDQNSLGYNNLLYLATVLAEFNNPTTDTEYLKVLLIEEPEAHLHPQLQTKLLKYLEENAEKTGVQIIVTTHSPVLSASVSIDTIVHMSKVYKSYSAIPIKNCGLSPKSKEFLNRWLDVTKSTLFFARGVLLVEGIAEVMLMPELAKIVLFEYNKTIANDDKSHKLPKSLAEAGVTVINMNGIYFKHFMQLFCELGDIVSESITVLCAGITDKDPQKDAKPTKDAPEDGNNPALELVRKVNASHNCRLYVGQLKTFEYDLAMEGGNLTPMITTFLELLTTDGTTRDRYKQLQMVNWVETSDICKKEVAWDLLHRVKGQKGEFAQRLAHRLDSESSEFVVPDYIRKAVLWVTKGEE